MTPSTTRRKRGAMATMHNIRKTLKDRRTDRLLAAGTSKAVIIKNIPPIAEKPQAVGQQFRRQLQHKHCQTNSIQKSNKRACARHGHVGRLYPRITTLKKSRL